MVGNQNIWGCTLASGTLNIWHVLMDAEMSLRNQKKNSFLVLMWKNLKSYVHQNFPVSTGSSLALYKWRIYSEILLAQVMEKNIKANVSLSILLHLCVVWTFYSQFAWNIVKGSCLSHRFPYWFSQCCNSQFLVEGCRNGSVINTTKAFSSQERAML